MFGKVVWVPKRSANTLNITSSILFYILTFRLKTCITIYSKEKADSG